MHKIMPEFMSGYTFGLSTRRRCLAYLASFLEILYWSVVVLSQWQ